MCSIAPVHHHLHFNSYFPGDVEVSCYCSSSTSSGREPLEMNGTWYFTGRMPILSPSQQVQSSEGNWKHWPQPGKTTHWIHPILPTTGVNEGKDLAPFISALSTQVSQSARLIVYYLNPLCVDVIYLLHYPQPDKFPTFCLTQSPDK